MSGKTTTPWAPNTTGAPDPFYMNRREYLIALNELEATESVHTSKDGDYYAVLSSRPGRFDPDTFHPEGLWAVRKTERPGIRKVTP